MCVINKKDWPQRWLLIMCVHALKKPFVFVTLVSEPSVHTTQSLFTKHLQLFDEVCGFLS